MKVRGTPQKSTKKRTRSKRKKPAVLEVSTIEMFVFPCPRSIFKINSKSCFRA